MPSKLTLLKRKKDSRFFSIEKIFDILKPYWEGSYVIYDISLPDLSITLKNMCFVLWNRFSKKADIYHVTGHAHYIVFFLNSYKTILTIHDCGFIEQYNGFKKWIIKKILIEWPVKRVSYITTISEKSKQEILHYTGCESSKITVIPNPVSAIINYIPRQFCKESPILLFIGFTPNKNLLRVIEAVEGIDCSLRIVGSLNQYQMTQLSRSNIKYSHVIGLSEIELNEEYINCDILLFPSTYEGFGLPIIEAQKAGRAVITSDISPMREVAGNAACLVDPLSASSIRQAILKVIAEDEYRNELIKNGFSNAKHFSPENIALLYKELYTRVLSKNNDG